MPRAMPPGRSGSTNRGGLCHKGWTSAEVLRLPDRITEPLVRNAVRCPGAERRWERGARRGRGRVQALQAAHGPDTVAVFGGGGLTNEKAYQLGKFARIALRTRHIDYNGRFCMSSAAAAGNRAFGIDRGTAVPARRRRRGRRRPAAREQRGRHDAAAGPAPRGRSASAAASSWSTRAARRRRRSPTATDGAGGAAPPAAARHRPGAAARAAAPRRRRGSGRRGLPRRPHHRLGRRTPLGGAVVARPGRRGSPASPRTPCGGPRDPARRRAPVARRARVRSSSPAAASEQHTEGTATVTAAINLALALGLPGRPASGYGCLTGQGNGQGGREHGQKSDQLPGYRMIDDPAARAHVAGVWGVDPDTLPGKGVPAVRAARQARWRGAGAVRARGQPAGQRAGRDRRAPSAGGARPARGVRLRAGRDRAARRRRAAGHPVGRGGGHHDQPRGPGAPPPQGGRPARSRRAASCEILADLATAARTRPVHFDTEPAQVFDELARASAGGRADYSGLSHARLDADAGGALLAGARARPPARRGCSPTASRTRTAVPGWSRSRRARRPDDLRRRGAGLPRHRPRAGAVPVGRPDPARRRPSTRSRRRPFVELHPTLAQPARRRRRRRRRGHLGAGHGGRACPDHHGDPAGHGVHAVPLAR